MESDEVEKYKLGSSPSPFIFCTKLISLQAQIVSNCIVSLASPFFSVISLVSELFRGAKEEYFQPVSSGTLLLWRIGMGLLAAAYVCMVLIIVGVAAALLGVGLVRAWVEEPVYVRESLHFDYTDAHPTAVFCFGGPGHGHVPVGHTLYVSLILFMPDSDYNRDIGIFQLTAELISVQGNLIAKSSHPIMLQFRSWPIRYMRTFLMGVPLLLGITTETQRITFPMLKHKEASYPRTEDVRITLIPRAGTSSLPQFYDAEVLVRSRPPWTKELVYKWKLTFYVWTTMYIFVMLVMVLVFFLKPLIFPVMATPFGKFEQDSAEESSTQDVPLGRTREERDVSESLRRWQRSRSKRKAALLYGVMPESSFCCSASSMTVSPGEAGVSFEEGSGDSESVCCRGS